MVVIASVASITGEHERPNKAKLHVSQIVAACQTSRREYRYMYNVYRDYNVISQFYTDIYTFVEIRMPVAAVVAEISTIRPAQGEQQLGAGAPIPSHTGRLRMRPRSNIDHGGLHGVWLVDTLL